MSILHGPEVGDATGARERSETRVIRRPQDNQRSALAALAIAAVGLLVCPTSVMSGDAETAKLITEDAFAVDAARTELELGYQYATAERLFSDDGQQINRGALRGQSALVKVTRGIRSGLDVSLEIVWRELIEDVVGDSLERTGNFTANTKWQFFENEKQSIAVAWVPGVTGAFAGVTLGAGLAPGQNYWSVNNLLVLSYGKGAFNLNLDAGHFLPIGDDRHDQRSQLIGDIAAGWQLRPWLQLGAEVNFGHATVSRGNGSVGLAVTGNAILNVSETVRIDVGVQEVLDGRNADDATIWVANFSKTF